MKALTAVDPRDFEFVSNSLRSWATRVLDASPLIENAPKAFKKAVNEQNISVNEHECLNLILDDATTDQLVIRLTNRFVTLEVEVRGGEEYGDGTDLQSFVNRLEGELPEGVYPPLGFDYAKRWLQAGAN